MFATQYKTAPFVPLLLGVMRDLNEYSPLPRATSNPLLLPLQSLHPSICPGTSFLFEINQFTGMGGEGGV